MDNRIKKLLGRILLLWVAALHGWAAEWKTQAVLRDYTARPPACFIVPIWMTPTEVRIDARQFSGEQTDLRYKTGDRVLRYVNHAKASYTDINEASLSQISGAFDNMMEYVREKMGQETQEPRRQPLTINKDATPKMIQGTPCFKHTVFRGDKLLQEVWAADWRASGIAATDFEALKQLAATYGNMAAALRQLPGMEGLMQIPVEGLLRISAYPLVIKQFGPQGLAYEIALGLPVPVPAVSEPLFAAPTGYTKASLLQLLQSD